MNSGIPITQLTAAPFVVTIPTSQWSSGDGDYYITVQATNITQDSILIPTYDHDSESLLNGSIWCVPDIGSFTIHTNKIPSGAVTILVQFSGVLGEAQYQVLADVYSKSQTYSKDQAVAKTEIINNLTSTATDKPLSANMGKMLNDKIEKVVATTTSPNTVTVTSEFVQKINNIVWFHFLGSKAQWAENDEIATVPDGYRPSYIVHTFATNYNMPSDNVQVAIGTDGVAKIWNKGTQATGNIYIDTMWFVV